METFDLALAFTLKEEGGFVDDPKDHGGATNRGITQATYDKYRKSITQPVQDVRLITNAEVSAIYWNSYWLLGCCGQMPVGLAIAHFDWCVNHGPAGAIETLQGVLGVDQDGQYGPASAAALADDLDAEGGLPALLARYLGARRQWYNDRVVAEPDQERFLAGWLARVDRLQAYIVQLIGGITN